MNPIQYFLNGMNGFTVDPGQLISQGTSTGRFGGDIASAIASTQFAPQIGADENRRTQISQLVANIQDPHVRQQALNFLGQNRLNLNTVDNGKGPWGVGIDAAGTATELIPAFRGLSRAATASRLFPSSAVQGVANYPGVAGTAINAGHLADRFSFMGNGYETPSWLLNNLNTPTNLSSYLPQSGTKVRPSQQMMQNLIQQRDKFTGQFTNKFK